MAKPVHVNRIFVRATPEAVWQAITDPEFTSKYFYETRFESTLQPGAGYRYVMDDGSAAVEGAIEEVDPPRRLVMTWRTLYDADLAAEPPSRVEWVLTPGDGVTTVTVIHRDLGRSPATAASVETGWVWVLDSMKSLLETGAGLPGRPPEAAAADFGAVASEEAVGTEHRRYGIDANNSTWELLDGRELSADEIDDVLERAYAAAYHWRRAAGRAPENAARASWLVSHVHAVLGHGELALHHADRCSAVVAEAALVDFDLAYAHECRARALACLGRIDEARGELDAAGAVVITGDEDAKIVEGDLAAGPWYGLDV